MFADGVVATWSESVPGEPPGALLSEHAARSSAATRLGGRTVWMRMRSLTMEDRRNPAPKEAGAVPPPPDSQVIAGQRRRATVQVDCDPRHARWRKVMRAVDTRRCHCLVWTRRLRTHSHGGI